MAVLITWSRSWVPSFVTALKRDWRRASTSAVLRSIVCPEIWEEREGEVSLVTALEMRPGFEEAIETWQPPSRASWATAKPIPDEPLIMRIDWSLMEGILESWTMVGMSLWVG